MVQCVVSESEIQKEILTLRLSMQGSTLGFVIYLMFLLYIFFGFLRLLCQPMCIWEVNLWTAVRQSALSLSRSRCGVAISSRLWLGSASQGASLMSLRIWYWERERTCRGASPSDEHSGDSESQWGTFPWPQATQTWNRDRHEGNRLQGKESVTRVGDFTEWRKAHKMKKK